MFKLNDNCCKLDMFLDLTPCLKIIQPFIKKFETQEQFFRDNLIRNNEYIVNTNLELQGTVLDKHRHLKKFKDEKYNHNSNDLLLQFLKPEFGISIHGPYFNKFMPNEYHNLISILTEKGLSFSIEYPCFAITFNTIQKHHDLREGCALNVVLQQGNTFLRIYENEDTFLDFCNAKYILFNVEKKHEVLNNSNVYTKRISLTITFKENYNVVKDRLKEYILHNL